MEALNALISNYLPDLDYGDLGLLLWADSIADRKNSNLIWRKIQADNDYLFITQDSFFSMMDISWLLTGLCYYYVYTNNKKEVSKYCKHLADVLKSNFVEETNLFRDDSLLKRRNFMAVKVQNEITSFASQVYPITALSVYSQCFEDASYINIAEQCAMKICQFQGDYGQWPWLYNTTTGTVVDSYPICSVHQGGMAPFALLELQKTLKTTSYNSSIIKGFEWLYGNNELGYSILDQKRGIIWRAIQRRDSNNLGPYGIGWSGKCNRFLSAWFGGITLEQVFNKAIGFEVLMETRPYEYGWYLWAFSDYKS
jgi:hypothetical protein